MTLTPKQQAFADYYIECGNATEAARRAGYSANNVGENAAKTLKKPNVSAYISQRMNDLAQKRVADANEAMEFLTSVMRGEVKDQFGLDAALSDRLKACEGLMKRFAACGLRYGESKREEDPLTKSLREEAERMNNGDFS